MYKFLPYMTNDFSIGLYDESVNDIYHSAYGALSEAFEKFVTDDVVNLIYNKNDIMVLDICYGIGYNTKAFIQTMLNTDANITIDCVDNDRVLIELSPFIMPKVGLFDRIFYKKRLVKNIENYEEANKIISTNFKKEKYRISPETNLIILKNLIENLIDDFDEINLSDVSKKILTERENHVFLDKIILKMFNFLSKNRIYLHQNKNNLTFLHNIYYNHISKQYKMYNKIRKFDNFRLKFYPVDIRKHLKHVSCLYDVVFLDGFTPAKCPCIWSVDFFKRLFELLADDGLIVTYNMSAPVRKAMLMSGFYIGNTLYNGKTVGTIATKNKLLIKNNLSDKQQGILETKAGIPYRDYDLAHNNETILYNREEEVKSSNLINASKYLKEYNTNKGC